MNIKKLSRAEKEKLYIEKMTKLQQLWKNPIDDDYSFDDWTDEQLDKGLEDTLGQLNFEKWWKIITFTAVAFFTFIISWIFGYLD